MLAKLRRSVPKLRIRYVHGTSAGLFSANDNDKYGLIQYEYAGKRDQSYSNSQEEMLEIIYGLAGITVIADPVVSRGGHPLPADATGYWWWFYLVLPLIFLCSAVYAYRGDCQNFPTKTCSKNKEKIS
jgi:hypothetical protein